MKSPLIARIEAIKANRPRNKSKAFDKLASDLGLMSNVVKLDFKNKKVIK